MTLCTANFEAGVNGNNILSTDVGSPTAWDSTAVTGSGARTYDNAHVAHGSLAARFFVTGGAGTAICTWSTALGTVTDQYGRVYIYFTANPSAAAVCFPVRFSSVGVAKAALVINATGKVELFDAAVSVGVTAASIALNQWVRLEWHIVHSATVGQVEVKLFNTAESDTPTETVTSAANKNTGASVDSVAIGYPLSASINLAWWADDLIVGAAAYPGPVSVATANPDGILLGHRRSYFYNRTKVFAG